MSIEAEDIDHKSTQEELLFKILLELRVISANLEVLSDLNNDWVRDDEDGEIDV